QAGANLVLGDGENAPLLLEGAGCDFGRVGIDRDRGDAGRRGHVAQMLAEGRLVDLQVLVERQQHGRNDAVGNVGLVSRHASPRSRDFEPSRVVSDLRTSPAGRQALGSRLVKLYSAMQPSLGCVFVYLGVFAFRKVRRWRIASGTRSLASF